MNKNVGLTYVKDFTFPSEQGFTGSAGVHKVRGYMRGGSVKKNSMHGKLTSEGSKMGYAYGGQVKPSNTSAEFVAKRGKQATMDHGVQPAQTGRNQAEVEAGGNKRLKAGYKHGGGVRRVRLHKSASRRAPGTTRSAKGGLAKYAAGGLAKKAGAAQ